MNLNPDHVVWLVVALINAYTAWISFRTHEATVKVAENVQVIEKATNSMKDALVASTQKAAFAEGKESGRLQEADRGTSTSMPLKA